MGVLSQEDKVMSDNRKEQVEALQAMLEYNPRLLAAMKSVTAELLEDRQPDTDEYLLAVIKGMNWETEILNGTKEVLDEQEIELDRKMINQVFLDFNEAYKQKDDITIGLLYRDKIIPFFELYEKAARNVVESNQ